MSVEDLTAGPVAEVPAAERVELSMPVAPELFALVRMLVSVTASRLGFDYEAVCDLRLAVDELVTICTNGHRDGSRITLWSSTGESALRVDCIVSPVSERVVAHDEDDAGVAGHESTELAQQILDVLVDGHGNRFDPVAETRTGWLWKTRPNS